MYPAQQPAHVARRDNTPSTAATLTFTSASDDNMRLRRSQRIADAAHVRRPTCEKLSKRASESGEAVSRPFHVFLNMRKIVRALGKIAEQRKVWAQTRNRKIVGERVAAAKCRCVCALTVSYNDQVLLMPASRFCHKKYSLASYD